MACPGVRSGARPGAADERPPGVGPAACLTRARTCPGVSTLGAQGSLCSSSCSAAGGSNGSGMPTAAKAPISALSLQNRKEMIDHEGRSMLFIRSAERSSDTAKA